MEVAEKEALNEKCPKKLDFNAPILSTRQSMGVTKVNLSRANSQVAACDACNRIPFSWEQIPGKPKDLEMIDNYAVDVPTPKLPPGGWHLSKEAVNEGISEKHCDYNDGCDDTFNRIPFSWEQIAGKPKDLEMIDSHAVDVPTPELTPGRWHLSKEAVDEGIIEQHSDYDYGCDADVEDEDDGNSSYAIDIFSLGDESMDMVELQDKAKTPSADLEQQQQSSGSHSPDFIIKRFLPDARALAASSLLTASNIIDKNVAHSSSCTSICVRKPYPSSKSTCGLNFFFPWRMKPKPCGGKNIVQATTSPKLLHEFDKG